MSRVAALTMLVLVAGTLGCAEASRSVLQLETPRMYIHTHVNPDELLSSVQTDDCILETGNPIVVRGTGIIRWPFVTVSVRDSSVVVNGIEVNSESGRYRNVTVDKNGGVHPDTFISWE